jgi:Ion channel
MGSFEMMKRKLLKIVAQLRRHPAGLLLMAQLAGVVLYPVLDDSIAGRTLVGGFGLFVLALVLWVVNRSPAVNWVAWCMALPAAVLMLAANVVHQTWLLPAAHVLEAVLYLYAAVGLIAYMFDDHRVTLDELLAVGAVFTLLAWSWAFAYSVCQTWYPGSFPMSGSPDAQRTWMELLFMSFSVLSGVGLSDIVPVTLPARALTMLQMFAGVMYIAIVVSRLVGLSAVRLRSD